MKQRFNNTAAVYLLVIVSYGLFLCSCKKDAGKNKSTNIITSNSDSDQAIEKSLSNNLVARYPFNGNTNDVSGNNNNVILNSNAIATAGKNGKPNSAYYFNGSSYMKVANSTTLNMDNITMVALVKVEGFYTGPCHVNRIISKGYNDIVNGRYALSFSDGLYYNYRGCNFEVQENFQNFGFEFGDGQAPAYGTVDSAHYIAKGTWYTVIASYDGAACRLFINGNLVSTSYKTMTFTPSKDPLFFGRTQDPSYPYYFTGIMDEIRIYNKGLNASQVKAITNIVASN